MAQFSSVTIHGKCQKFNLQIFNEIFRVMIIFYLGINILTVLYLLKLNQQIVFKYAYFLPSMIEDPYN